MLDLVCFSRESKNKNEVKILVLCLLTRKLQANKSKDAVQGESKFKATI